MKRTVKKDEVQVEELTRASRTTFWRTEVAFTSGRRRSGSDQSPGEFRERNLFFFFFPLLNGRKKNKNKKKLRENACSVATVVALAGG